jgi:5-methyltetrahydrofolate--homocysteine methyltransferase
MSKKCIYDPLLEIIRYFEKTSDDKNEIEKKDSISLSLEERLKNKIIDGEKTDLQKELDEALKSYTAVDIINTILLDGMKTVGELFGSGRMQLPFVLQSAEVMKTAVGYLEKFMEKSDSDSSKGKMIIATVKGDVHDIGKNLVDIILTNNGFKVINLGIKCPIENIIEKIEKENPDVVGMSGLLVKSTLIMKENLEILKERNINIPVILGGAALTRRYVENDLRSIYGDNVYYAQDAFDGLNLMNEIIKNEKLNLKTPLKTVIPNLRKNNTDIIIQQSEKSDVKPAEVIPEAPFWGVKIIDNVDLNEVFKYINEAALIRGQWQVRKKNLSEADYQKLLENEIYPVLKYWKEKCIQENIFQPKIVYGYFKCKSDGNDLIIYDEAQKSEIGRFMFPRQRAGKRLCISDFYLNKDSEVFDIFCGFFVTIGKKASEYSKMLYESNKYSDYLYFHGLSVESTEALAEFLHKQIREELGINGNDSKDIKGLFSQGYQGSRYSFGYPACPNLEDQLQLKELLNPEKIGIEITEEYQLVPEQSVSAIVVHHPQARYFNI